MRVFGDNKIDFAGQLLGSLSEEVVTKSSNDDSEYGGRGIVILTSSSAIEHSYEQEGLELSIYTHYLVEGLETGSADIDQDTRILAKELHDYVSDKVSQEKSLMTPQIFRVNEGGEIVIAEVKPIEIEPAERYRKGIEDYFIIYGKIPDERRKLVDTTANSLGLSPDEAAKIEDSVRKPYQEHEKNSNIYRENFYSLLRSDKCYPLPAEDLRSLKGLQQLLRLSDKDIEGINRSEILGFYKEKLNQIVNDPKTPKEVQRKADELMLSLSLAKQDVQKINNEVINRLSPYTNIFANVFKNLPFYLFVVIFLVIAYGYAIIDVNNNNPQNDKSQNKTPDVPPSIPKITDVEAPKGDFRYTTSSTWAPVVCGNKQEYEITKKGYGIDNYIEKKKGFKLTANIFRSDQAFENLIKDKEFAFAIFSSNITDEMRTKAKEKGIELDERIVAMDAIAFGANVNLKITDGLTKDNLYKIYVDGNQKWSDVLGDTSTWKEPSLQIKTVFRDFGNYTFVGTTKHFFLDYLKYNKSLDDAKQNLIISTVLAENTSAAIDKVKNTEGSIYFATATELYGNEIQIVPIKDDLTKKFQAPYTDKDFKPFEHCKIAGDNIAASSNRNPDILNKNYPKELIRPISVVWRKYNNTSGSDENKKNEKAAIAYAEMLKTKEGQEILMGMGYFPYDYK